MRIVIQRVKHASVTIDGNIKSAIQKGLLILLGIGEDDDENDVKWLVNKVIGLRIFDDEQGVMNKSVMDIGGEALVVSQFTLKSSKLHSRCQTRNLNTTLQVFLPRIKPCNEKKCGRRGVWCRYESRTIERWSCNNMYGYKEQRVTEWTTK